MLRERYKEQVAKLTHDLACRYRDSGAVDRAVHLFQQLLTAQPTLHPAARGFYRCYARRKDRQGIELGRSRSPRLRLSDHRRTVPLHGPDDEYRADERQHHPLVRNLPTSWWMDTGQERVAPLFTRH